MAVTMQCANAIHERATVVLVTPLGRQDDGFGFMGPGYFEDRRGEHRMRAQLDEVGISVIEHPADRGFEKNCGAGVLPPVGGAVGISVQPFAGDGGIQRDRRRVR